MSKYRYPSQEAVIKMGFDKNKVTMDLRYKIKQLKRKKYNAEQYKKMNNQKSIKKY